MTRRVLECSSLRALRNIDTSLSYSEAMGLLYSSLSLQPSTDDQSAVSILLQGKAKIEQELSTLRAAVCARTLRSLLSSTSSSSSSSPSSSLKTALASLSKSQIAALKNALVDL
jgi:hypothetical protein